MKFQMRALSVGLVAVMVAGFSYSSASAQEGGPPVLQPVLEKVTGPTQGAPSVELLGPALGVEESGPAVGGPVLGGEQGGPAPAGEVVGAVVEGPAVGGPAVGGPEVGGPAPGGPVVGGPAPVEVPLALVHHFVYAQKYEGYGKGHEIKMELLLFVDGTFKMIAPDHGHGHYGRREWKMGEWFGAWHLEDDELMIDYKGHGHNVGYITIADKGLRLRMDGHKWVDILTVK